MLRCQNWQAAVLWLWFFFLSLNYNVYSIYRPLTKKQLKIYCLILLYWNFQETMGLIKLPFNWDRLFLTFWKLFKRNNGGNHGMYGYQWKLILNVLLELKFEYNKLVYVPFKLLIMFARHMQKLSCSRLFYSSLLLWLLYNNLWLLEVKYEVQQQVTLSIFSLCVCSLINNALLYRLFVVANNMIEHVRKHVIWK